METTINSPILATKKTLNQLVNLLAAGSLPAAVQRKSFIVNEVPRAMAIAADENMLATVIGSMLQIVINHTENSCIRISANVLEKNINVRILDSGSFRSNAVASDLKQVQTLASMMGGYVSINKELEKVTGIAFSFPNLPHAA